jgi:hypothetical protein
VLFNIAFSVATVAAVALLGGVLFANWYSDHGAPIGSVNGVAISKDAVRDRAAVNLARYQRQVDYYGTMRNLGQITTTDYSGVTSPITSSEDPSSLYSEALTQLTEDLTLQQYASQQGISVSDADVDAQIVKDSTIPEMRYVKVIAVSPASTLPSSVPTAAQVTAAQTTAQGYLDSIKSGAKKWDDVAKVATANLPFGTSGMGELGLMSRDQSNLEQTLTDAIFGLAKANDMTTVIKGEDGVFRFATVTEIVATSVDNGWKDAVDSASSSDGYRSFARAEALKAAVKTAVESKLVTGSSTSRHVSEIYIASGFGQAGDGDEIKTKMMVFAPSHQPSGASALDPTTDQTWADAKTRADAAYAALQKDPTQFATLASDTTNNDDTNASSVPGGDYPWLPSSFFSGDPSSGAGLGMTNVATAIFAPDLKVGVMAPILEPTMGYVVVDFLGRRPSAAQRIADAQIALNTGSGFSDVAARYSEGPEAGSGGDLGWVARYQYSSDLEDAIFQAPIGGLSRMVQSGGGYYLFKVTEEATRVPDATQQAALKKAAFNTWLSNLTGAANVWTDSAGLTAITPASPSP